MIDPKQVQQRLAYLTATFGEWAALLKKEQAKTTRTGQRRLALIEKEFLPILEPVARSDFIYTTFQIAKFYDVSEKTIHNWAKRGLPQVRRGMWDLVEVNKWVNAPGAQGVDSAREELIKAQIEMTRLKIDQLSGELIGKEEIHEGWAFRTGEVTAALGSMPDRISPLAEGKDRAEIHQIITEEVHEIRNRFCRDGRYTPVVGPGAGKMAPTGKDNGGGVGGKIPRPRRASGRKRAVKVKKNPVPKADPGVSVKP